MLRNIVWFVAVYCLSMSVNSAAAARVADAPVIEVAGEFEVLEGVEKTAQEPCVAEAAEEKAAEEDPAVDLSAIRGREVSNVIFVVDDQLINRRILGTQITRVLNAIGRSDVKVEIFDSGDSFLAACVERSPAVAFVDGLMPGKTGVDVVRTLVANDFVGKIIAWSTDPGSIKAMQTLGAEQYVLGKPSDASDVHACVLEMLSRLEEE